MSPMILQLISSCNRFCCESIPRPHILQSRLRFAAAPSRSRPGQRVIWFDFQDLCEGPGSKWTMSTLSAPPHLLLSGVPQLDDDDNNAARRFIELIDELYDRRVNVVITAAALPDALISRSTSA